MKFTSTQFLATPGAIRAMTSACQVPKEFLDRHFQGDWGDLDDEDRQVNEDALRNGARILSAYHTTLGEKLWVITEAADDQGTREATTILLPDEY